MSLRWRTITSITFIGMLAVMVALLALSQSHQRAVARTAALESNLAVVNKEAEEQKRVSAKLINQANSNLTELARLRLEVSRLRTSSTNRTASKPNSSRVAAPITTLTNATITPAAPESEAPLLARDTWQFAGYDTPADALQSLAWAMREGNIEVFLESLSPEIQESLAEEFRDQPVDEISKFLQKDISNIKALRLNTGEVSPEGDVTFTLASSETDDGTTKTSDRTILTFRLVDGEWKMAGHQGSSVAQKR